MDFSFLKIALLIATIFLFTQKIKAQDVGQRNAVTHSRPPSIVKQGSSAADSLNSGIAIETKEPTANSETSTVVVDTVSISQSVIALKTTEIKIGSKSLEVKTPCPKGLKAISTTTNTIHTADHHIIASDNLKSSSNFVASSFIDLEPGFDTIDSEVFEARIQGCDF